jgi:hypothetical protein
MLAALLKVDSREEYNRGFYVIGTFKNNLGELTCYWFWLD